jgi:hypothetical protein
MFSSEQGKHWDVVSVVVSAVVLVAVWADAKWSEASSEALLE